MKRTGITLLLLPLLVGSLVSCGEKKEFDDPYVEVTFKEAFDDLGEKCDAATSLLLKEKFIAKCESGATTYRRYIDSYSKDERNLNNESNSNNQRIYRIYDDNFLVEEYSGSGVSKEDGKETKSNFSTTSYEYYRSENDLYIEVDEYSDDRVKSYVSDFSKREDYEKEAAKKQIYRDATSNLTSYIRYDDKLDIYKAKDGNGYIYIYNNVYEYVRPLDETMKYTATYQQYIHFNEEYELILETFYYTYSRTYSAYTGEKYDDAIIFSENKSYSYASYGDRVVGEERLNELKAKYDKRRIETAYVDITEIKYEDGTHCDNPGYLPGATYLDRDLKVFECSTRWYLNDLHVGKAHTIRYDLEVYIYDGLFSNEYEKHILIPDLKVKEGDENYLSFDKESSLITFIPTEEDQDIIFTIHMSLDEHGDVEIKDALVEVDD